MEGCGSYSVLKSHGLELHRYVEYDKHGELDQEDDGDHDDYRNMNENDDISRRRSTKTTSEIPSLETSINRRISTKATLEVPSLDTAELYNYCRKGSIDPVSNWNRIIYYH